MSGSCPGCGSELSHCWQNACSQTSTASVVVHASLPFPIKENTGEIQVDFCWSGCLVTFLGQYMDFPACLEMQADAAASALPQHWCSAACTGHTEGVCSKESQGCHTQTQVDGHSLSLAHPTCPPTGLQPFPDSATTSMGWLPRHGGSALLGQEGLHEFD